MKKVLLTAAVAIATFFGANAQSNIYVDVNATGANNGSSWANAFTHIDSAVVHSNGIADNILVKAGIYKQQTTISKFVKIYGGFNGTETSYTQADPVANPVIFDADLNGDDIAGDYVTNKGDNLSYHLNIQNSGNNFDLKVEGITFKNARRLTYSGSSVFFRVDGPSNISASFKNCKWLQNCNVSNGQNGAIGGGAVNVDALNGGFAQLEIDKCWFEGNSDQGNNTYGSAIAAASYANSQVSLFVTNSVFTGNTDVNTLSGKYVIYVSISSLASASTVNSGVIRNNTFYGNNNNWAVLFYNGKNDATLDYTFDRNIVSGGDLTMVIGSSTTTNNPYAVANNNNYLTSDPNTVIDHVNGLTQTNNNQFGSIPGFVNAANKDFNLTASSSCLDVQSTLLTMPDNLDYAGNPRLSGTGVDIGAYEYQVPSNNCAITNINVENTTCTGQDTYSATLTVFYENEPTSGTLNVATFDFPITGSPQTVTLNNLSSSGSAGNPFTSQAFFTAEPSCEYAMNNFWTIPDCSNVGIDEFTNQEFVSIYPNPANSTLNIEVKETTNIKIVNVLGKTVATQQLQIGNNSIDVSNLTNGVYFIHSDKGGAVKFVKE